MGGFFLEHMKRRVLSIWASRVCLSIVMVLVAADTNFQVKAGIQDRFGVQSYQLHRISYQPRY